MSIIRQLARVANRIDSASTGTFLSKGDSTGDFTLVDYTDLSGRPTTLDSAALTTIVDSAYIQLRQTSAGSGGLDSAEITALVDSNYVVARSPSASSGFANYEYTATAGQTTFQDSDINGNVMSYTADGIFVFYNGVLIAPTTDYEATDGSSVVLTTGADSGSHVAISKWSIAGGGSGGSSFTWGGDRVTVAGGIPSSGNITNVIDYYNITSTSNAADFGDLLASGMNFSAVSSTSRVVYGPYNTGTSSSTTNILQYITPSTTSNATDFGDRTVTYDACSTTSDGTYGLFSGSNGINNGGAPYSTDVIDYITIATTSNATDFGDLTAAQEAMASGVISNGTYGILSKPQSDFSNYVTIATPANATLLTMTSATSGWCAAFSDNTYGVIQGGQTIEYFSIGTTISVTDFGDTTTSQSHAAGASNGTYGTINAGYKFDGATNIYNIIEYVTIATPANATDFGDLTVSRYQLGAGSGSPS